MRVRREYHNLAGALATDGTDPATVWAVVHRALDPITAPTRGAFNG